jgi:hypothetical protein
VTSSHRNAGKPWSANEDLRLANHASGNTPMRLIVVEFGRPEEEVLARLGELGLEQASENYNRLNLDLKDR